jgi:hypothetical protein
MESICAIVDVQGFVVENEFIPRELAYCELDGPVKSHDIGTNINFRNMSVKDKITNRYIMNYTTGLTIRAPDDCIPKDKLKIFLAMMYGKYSTIGKVHFGIKNPQLGELLDSIGVPWIEIKSPCTHNLAKYYKKETNCKRHVLNEDGKCSVAKVDLLKNWLIDSKYLEELI